MKKYLAILLILLLIPIVLAESDKTDKDNRDANKLTNVQEQTKIKENQPGLQAINALETSITKGNASDKSIEVRKRAIERIKTRLQEKNLTKEELKERIRNRIENIKDLSLIVQEKHKEKLEKIAEKLNESNDNATILKEKIQKRNKLMRFLVGHEKKIIKNFKEQIQINEERIKELESIKTEVSVEVAAVLDEQITSLKEENQKLQQFIEKEQKKFSLFGWLKKE